MVDTRPGRPGTLSDVSYSIDVNLLLYASDEGSPFHSEARAFVESCATGTQLLCLSWTTLMAYLRIATHAAIFRAPLSPSEARHNIENLLALPHVRLLSEDEGFWEVYVEATKGMTVRGNLVPDAHLAALMKQHDVRTIYTNDSDFRRFTFLDVRNPLTSR